MSLLRSSRGEAAELHAAVHIPTDSARAQQGDLRAADWRFGQQKEEGRAQILVLVLVLLLATWCVVGHAELVRVLVLYGGGCVFWHCGRGCDGRAGRGACSAGGASVLLRHRLRTWRSTLPKRQLRIKGAEKFQCGCLVVALRALLQGEIARSS